MDQNEVESEVKEKAGEFQADLDQMLARYCQQNFHLMPEIKESLELQLQIASSVRKKNRWNREYRSGGEKGPAVLDVEAIEAFERRYIKSGQLGGGAEGIVSQYYQPELNRRVAIKKLTAGRIPRESLMQEALTMSAIQHPNVPKVYEVVRVGEDQVRIVRDFVDGIELRRYIAEHNPDGQLSPRETAEIFRKVADVAHLLLRTSLLHLDFKPENIIITPNKEPIVIDFGLANFVSNEISESRGTPQYKAPEFLLGEKPDHRCDIYSIGVTLYESLTSKRPVPNDLLAKQDFTPKSVRLENSSVPRDLEAICMKCLERDPKQRYQEAGQLRDDLTCFLSFETVSCRKQINSAERSYKFFRRNPVSTIAGLSMIVLLAVSSIYYFIDAKRQNKVARIEAEQRELVELDVIRQKQLAESESKGRKLAEAELLNRTLAAASSAGSRGLWKEMATGLERAIEQAPERENEFNFMMLTPLDALGDQRFFQFIEKLDREIQPEDPIRAPLYLWMAEVQDSNGKFAEADKLIEMAKSCADQSHVSESHIAYIAAMQSETTPEAIKHLEQSISLQQSELGTPYNYRANLQLATEYWMQGRRADARLKCHEIAFAFPGDKQYNFLLGLVDVSEGKHDHAMARLKTMQLTDQERTTTTALYSIAEKIFSNDVSGRQGFSELLPLLLELVKLSLSSRSDKTQFGFRITRRLNASFYAALPLLVNVNSKAAFEKLAKINPEGTLLTEMAVRLLRSKLAPEEKLRQADELAERALDGEFLLPSYRPLAEFIVFAADFQADYRPEHRARLSEYLNQHYPKTPDHLLAIQGMYACFDGEYLLADACFASVLKSDPDFVAWKAGSIRIWAAFVAAKLNEFSRSLQLLENGELVLPKDLSTIGSVEKIIESAREGLQRQMETPN